MRIWRAPAPRWRRSVPPGFIRPCEPALVAYPPAGPGWLHEIKHDGFRILAWKQGEHVLVLSRRGADFTGRFARIADAVRGLSADEALIDGEAVVFRDDGRSDFVALLTKRGWAEALFAAFDLLRPAATICASVRLRSGGRRSCDWSPALAESRDARIAVVHSQIEPTKQVRGLFDR